MLVHRYGVNGFKLYGLPVPREGKILGVIGKNGAGKSTALRILAGELRPNLGYASALLAPLLQVFWAPDYPLAH